MRDMFFLQDLAAVMLAAGLVVVLFHRIRQPIILGYLAAGMIIGPKVALLPLIHDAASVHSLANLGLIFLMFSLGMDFSLRKLVRMGPSVLVIAVLEIMAMSWIGWQIAFFMGWTTVERLMFGIMLALTSTTIVVKSLQETGETGEKHGEIMSAVCIFEDIFVLVVMILLPGLERTGGLSGGAVFLLLAKLVIIGLAAAVVGLLTIPRVLNYVGRIRNDEMLLIFVLGIGFGLAILAEKTGYSPALGAFMAGAMVAESRHLGRIERMVMPLRDMFCAVFFVAIGMLIDPRYIAAHFPVIVLLTAVYVVAKVGACSFGTFLVGYDGRTTMKVGTGMAQIGEFGFILASMGMAAGVIGDSLYPAIVAMAALNALVRPYIVGNADRLAFGIRSLLPRTIVHILRLYGGWLAQFREQRKLRATGRIFRNLIWQITLNAVLIAAAFLAAALVSAQLPPNWSFVPERFGGTQVVLWFMALLVCLPVYVVTARKFEALGMMIAEVTVAAPAPGSRTDLIHALVGRIIHAGGMVGLAMLTVLVSAPLLPPWHMLLVILAIAAGLVLFWGAGFNRWYGRAKFSLLETWTQPPPLKASSKPLPAMLSSAELEDTVVRHPEIAGRLIREIKLRKRTGVSIVAIERNGKAIINPGPDEELQNGDRVLLLGAKSQLAVALKVLDEGTGAPPEHS